MGLSVGQYIGQSAQPQVAPRLSQLLVYLLLAAARPLSQDQEVSLLSLAAT